MKTMREIIEHHERAIAQCDRTEQAMLYVGVGCGILFLVCLITLANL